MRRVLRVLRAEPGRLVLAVGLLLTLGVLLWVNLTGHGSLIEAGLLYVGLGMVVVGGIRVVINDVIPRL
jgi:hypothetical protein